MSTLIRELIRPYRGTLLLILLAMLVETAMSLAGPWPLKIIIDNVIGSHPLPHKLDQMIRLSTIRDADKIIVIEGGIVIEALERLMKGRTVITIAHRAESGTHDELMMMNGIYAALHRTQFDERSAKASS